MNMHLKQVTAAIKENFKKITKDYHGKFLLINLLFFLFLFVLPNNKFFFIWSFLYLLVILLLTASIEETIVYIFWPFYIFEAGQLYIKQVIPESFLMTDLYGNGRSIYLLFSPFLILTIVLFFVYFVRVFVKKEKTGISFISLLFLISFFFATFAVKSSIIPAYSFFYFWEKFSFLIWFLLLKSCFFSANKKKREQFLVSLFQILLLIFSLDLIHVLIQYFRGAVLGTVIEKAYSLPSFGEGSDEFSSVRPIGLHSHANSLSNWIITLFFTFPLFYPILRKKGKKNFINKFFLVLYLSIFFVLAISLSRSAYLALIISFLFMLIFEKKFLIKIVSYLCSILEKFKLIFLIAIFFVSIKIGQRLYHSFYSFSGNGGFSTRTSQFKDAFSLIKMNPFFGFGIGMFIPVMFHLIPGGDILSFPENVHNGFLLFIAERGIISFFFSFLAIFFLLRGILFKKIKRIYKTLFVLGIISNFVMMIFQPFDNMMSLNIMMSELILLGEKNEKK